MTDASSGITVMSPRRCAVCSHEDREAIDRDLIQRHRTQTDIARQVGVDRSTVSRHYKNHVLPALATAMVTEPGDVSIGNLIAEFDDLYGSNLQIREMAISRDDLRLAKDVNAEQRRLLEVLLKHGDKIGSGSVSDAIGDDRDRWAAIERDAEARHVRAAREYIRRYLRAITTLGDLPDNVRGPITEIALRGQLSDKQLAALDARLAEDFGDEWPDSAGDEDQVGTS